MLFTGLAEKYKEVLNYVDKIVLLGPAASLSNIDLFDLFNLLMKFDLNKYEYSDRIHVGYLLCKNYNKFTLWLFNMLMDSKESPVAYEYLCNFMAIYPGGTSK